MRVAITGATGFVGGALARALVQRGAEVHALVRRSSDRSSLRGLPIAWHEGDVTVREGLADFLDNADCVVHAAGQLGRAGIPEEAYNRIHAEGTRNILAEVEKQNCRTRVLHVSTCGVLGPTTITPVSEAAQLAPSNPYERSKAAAERCAREFAQGRLPVIIARPGFLYGPGDLHVHRLFRAIQRRRFFYIGAGRSLCQPVFIEDAVAGLLLCLERGRPGEVYHITGPAAVSFRELATTIACAMQVRPPRLSLPRWSVVFGAMLLEALSRSGGNVPPLTRTGVAFFTENRVFSGERALRELGFRPQCDLAIGIARTVAWYRQYGWL